MHSAAKINPTTVLRAPETRGSEPAPNQPGCPGRKMTSEVCPDQTNPGRQEQGMERDPGKVQRPQQPLDPPKQQQEGVTGA